MKVDRRSLPVTRARSEAALDFGQPIINMPFPACDKRLTSVSVVSAGTNLFDEMLSHDAHNQISFLAPDEGISPDSLEAVAAASRSNCRCADALTRSYEVQGKWKCYRRCQSMLPKKDKEGDERMP